MSQVIWKWRSRQCPAWAARALGAPPPAHRNATSQPSAVPALDAGKAFSAQQDVAIPGPDRSLRVERAATLKPTVRPIERLLRADGRRPSATLRKTAPRPGLARRPFRSGRPGKLTLSRVACAVQKPSSGSHNVRIEPSAGGRLGGPLRPEKTNGPAPRSSAYPFGYLIETAMPPCGLWIRPSATPQPTTKPRGDSWLMCPLPAGRHRPRS